MLTGVPALLMVLCQSNADARLALLTRERTEFNERVRDSSEDEMITLHHTIYSMGPGSQKIYGFYPYGHSDRRYLLAVYSNCPLALLYQVRRNGKALTRWALRLDHIEPLASGFSGSLGRLLAGQGARVRGRVTPAIRASLNARATFAAYGYDGDNRFFAWTLGPDGQETEREACEEGAPYPILAAEEAAIRRAAVKASSRRKPVSP